MQRLYFKGMLGNAVILNSVYMVIVNISIGRFNVMSRLIWPSFHLLGNSRSKVALDDVI